MKDNCGGLDDLYVALERLLDSVHRGSSRTSSWRIPRDAADAAWDTLADRIVDGRAPDNAIPWLRTILRNLLKAGPERIGLGPGTTSLETEPSSKSTDGHRVPSELDRRTFLAGYRRLWQIMTPAERRVLRAVRRSKTHSQAISESGMSGRDYRTRFRRVVAKARYILDASE